MSEPPDKKTIWVDADAAPRAARAILVRAADRREIQVVLVANSWLDKPKSKWVSVELVSAGADVADDFIVEHIEKDELCITSDIPLAARVVEKGGFVVTAYGRDLDENSVSEALSVRDFHTELRDLGVQTGGQRAYDDRAKREFGNALDRWITRYT